MPEEDLLLDLLLEWEDSWRDGRELSAEELCVNSPRLLQALKHRIEDARRVEAFLGGRITENTRHPLHRLPTARDGRYRIERFVAGGTSGEVYEAFDERLKRRVAIKLQRQIHGDEFLREARSVVQLDHPGIVRVYDVDRAEDRRVFIVMQWIDGGTLADHVQRKIAPSKVAQLLLQVADGVAYAHGANVVHRDLKPANILMDGRGTPRVADFGLALHDDSQRADTGQLVGTPAYMSPEQVLSKAIGCDGRTDVWALGVILYELLAKQRPFRGPTQEKLFAQILQARPTPLRKLVSHLPTELERICQRCLAAEPNERYPSAAELAAHLRRWLNRRRRVLHRVQFAVVLLMIATAGLGTWTYQERAKRLAADVAFIARETEQGRQDFLAGEASQSLPHLRDAYAVAQRTSSASPALRFLLARAASSIQRQIHTFALQDQFLSGVHVSPDGARIAAIGSDGRARVWEISSGRVIFCSPASAAAPLSYVGFSPGGTRLLIVCGTDAAVWDVTSGKEVFGCHGHEMDIKWAAFSPDGRHIVTASADNTARIWSDSGAAPIVLNGHARTVLFAEFNVQGDQVITGSNDRTARLWNATNGKLIREFKGHKGGVGFGTVIPAANPAGGR